MDKEKSCEECNLKEECEHMRQYKGELPNDCPRFNKPFDVDEKEILALIKQNKVETTWSLAMEMADKIYELSGDAELAEQYRSRYHDLYYKEAEQAEKQRNDELDYFCGRHTFFPWEI